LKICRPLISRMRKQSALIQWQISTRAECLCTILGSSPAHGAEAEVRDAMA
jgi:hypothetical protein